MVSLCPIVRWRAAAVGAHRVRSAAIGLASASEAGVKVRPMPAKRPFPL